MENTSFCCASDSDRMSMLESLGLDSIDELYAEIPKELRCDSLEIADGMSEMDMLKELHGLDAKNQEALLFCGAGFYDHYIPAAVDAIANRGEFLTAYTPYQPEAAQGSLQAIFEYQSAIARLTGMEVSNASLYDGGSALFEGVLMAVNRTRRSKVVVDEGVNPIYRKMLKSYAGNLHIEYVECPLVNGLADRDAISAALDKDTAAVLLQNPNFFGCVDDLSDIIEAAHDVKALAVMSAYPMALALLKPPGEMGADIATGEGQNLGLPLSFGGPYLGYMAVTKKLARKMPGRVAGMTEDLNGERGFVLTLQTREQHIRREKATSNICTNQANCALRAVIYLSLLGKQGLIDAAKSCANNAGYALKKLTEIEGVEAVFDQPFFNEFALSLPRDAADVISCLMERGIASGFPAACYYPGMENVLLMAFTEKRSRDEIDHLVQNLRDVLESR